MGTFQASLKVKLLPNLCRSYPKAAPRHRGEMLTLAIVSTSAWKNIFRESYTRGLDLHACHTSEDALQNHTMQHVCMSVIWPSERSARSAHQFPDFHWFSPENPCLLISKTLTAQGTQRAFWGLPQEFSSTKVLEIFSCPLRGPSSDSRGFKATKHDLIMMSLLDWSAKAPRFHCFLFGRKGG